MTGLQEGATVVSQGGNLILETEIIAKFLLTELVFWIAHFLDVCDEGIHSELASVTTAEQI